MRETAEEWILSLIIATLTVEAKMKKAMVVTLTVVCGILLAVQATAGTRDDCISKCKEAATFIQTKGIDAAIKEIGNKNGRFVWNDGVSYVFLMNKGQNAGPPLRPASDKEGHPDRFKRCYRKTL
jgi:hypothetical protein